MNISTETIAFIKAHINDDVRALALRPIGDPNVDLRTALGQIVGHQVARQKLPTWARTEGIVYPPRLPMEQCSSERTALYKAAVAERLVKSGGKTVAGLLVDLTGGFGVDFSYLCRGFQRGLYVERQEELCRIAEHNFGVLGLAQATVMNANAEDALGSISEADLIFLDPARRNSAGQRTFAITDCTPDALALMPLLLCKTSTVMLKLSPMLDWRKAVSDFNGAVSEVHIVAVGGECKELLLVLRRSVSEHVQVFCVNDDEVLRFSTADVSAFSTGENGAMEEFSYISEPNAAVMKAGCFGLIERRFGVRRIGLNSNLFVSGSVPEGFLGRVFRVVGVSSMNNRSLKPMLAGVKQANITTRNFPLSVEELRKRLKLKEGGDCYIFATTGQDRQHLLVRCEKIKKTKKRFLTLTFPPSISEEGYALGKELYMQKLHRQEIECGGKQNAGQ